MAESREQQNNIWMLTREYGDLAGAGGVKDVACQLAEALACQGSRSLNIVLPNYGFMNTEELGFELLPDPLHAQLNLCLQVEMNLPDKTVSEAVQFYHRRLNRVNIYLVDAERYRQKKNIYTYTEEEEQRTSWQKTSHGHHDYFAMNVLLQKSALDLMICLGEKPDIIHCHDGHTALLPALISELSGYRAYFRATACLVTIHNAGYGYHQEIADNRYAHSITGLAEEIILKHQLEMKFDPFLVAGEYAVLNTVSENYARELQETGSDELTGWLGHELKSRNINIEGVTNGIDPEFIISSMSAWGDPEREFFPGRPEDDLSGKRLCKSLLLECIAKDNAALEVDCFGGLKNDAEMILLTFVGRLSEQKGVDFLIEVLADWLKEELDVQVLVLGSGSQEIEDELLRLTQDKQLNERVCFLKGYSSSLASKVYSAGDFLIIPSRYEPCGLTDFIGQLFGNIPIVHHVGGLVKVLDGVTGIAYQGNELENLISALSRAKKLFADPVAKRKMQYRAVKEIEERYVWSKVTSKYLSLYEKAVIQRKKIQND